MCIIVCMGIDKKMRTRESGGIAVGAYLRSLRENLELTPTEVAAQIKSDPTQIWRIETWKADVRSSLLFAYIRAVGGSPDDVARLINNPTASASDGELLAKLHISSK